MYTPDTDDEPTSWVPLSLATSWTISDTVESWFRLFFSDVGEINSNTMWPPNVIYCFLDSWIWTRAYCAIQSCGRKQSLEIFDMVLLQAYGCLHGGFSSHIHTPPGAFLHRTRVTRQTAHIALFSHFRRHRKNTIAAMPCSGVVGGSTLESRSSERHWRGVYETIWHEDDMRD